jgi:hypothetical protein
VKGEKLARQVRACGIVQILMKTGPDQGSSAYFLFWSLKTICAAKSPANDPESFGSEEIQIAT